MDSEMFDSMREDGEPSVLVTILAVKGSAPRHPGTKMLVGSRMDPVGTIGGGAGEVMALGAAKAAFASGTSSVIEVEMLGGEATGKDLICGGINRMLVEHVDDPKPYGMARDFLASGRRALFVKRLSRGNSGGEVAVESMLLGDDGKAAYGRVGGYSEKDAALALRSGKALFREEDGLFYDPVFPREKLLVIGAGHVGKALVNAASHLDFSITVADDRPEFVSEGSFPPGVNLMHGSYAEIFSEFAFDPATYVVILTRSHTYDLECVRSVLGKDYRYAGLIGSARKTRIIIDQALADGFSPEKVDALCAPIGIDISAETPSEIAVSILAEIVAVRRNSSKLASMGEDRKRRRA